MKRTKKLKFMKVKTLLREIWFLLVLSQMTNLLTIFGVQQIWKKALSIALFSVAALWFIDRYVSNDRRILVSNGVAILLLFLVMAIAASEWLWDPYILDMRFKEINS
ncbi:hypothetical protein AB1K84_03135 [Mesobacillus foraminis]|uniref:hypothetical protein n=1 Tax=Mesobacillus foraminis TaxID=279826 RepID=UPI0039A29734